MSLNNVICLAALLAFLLVSQALGGYQTIPFRQYNVSVDFGGKNVSIEPLANRSDSDSTSMSTIFRGSNATDWGAIYLFEYGSTPALDLRDRIWKLMKSYCTMPDIDPATIAGQSGFISTGKARVEHGFGKQVCYSGIAPLPTGGTSQRDFVVMGHFTDAKLNEQFVRTAKIEFVGKIVKI